jgi:hypothetical protein
MVTGLERCNARSALHHNASTFVAADEWEEVVDAHHGQQFLWWNHVARHKVLVGVAHSGHLPIHKNFVGFWFVYFNFLNHPWLINPVKNGCT